MAPPDPRSAYRDELNAARLRIESLEGELEARRADKAGGGQALDAARARAFELEARASELEQRVRELERAASERSRRAAERVAERRSSRPSRAHTPPPPAEATRPGHELVWSLLGLVTLAALAVLASSRVGVVVALLAVVVGAAASQAFFGRFAGRAFGRPGRDGWQERGGKAVPPPRPGSKMASRPGGPTARPRSPFGPPPSSGRGTRTRFTAKRGRD